MKKVLMMMLFMVMPIAAWCYDGDSFSTNTEEGVKMWFRVTSEAKKECQVGVPGYAISTSTTGRITIPSEANGYTVVSIGNQAFCNCTGITTVIIPNSVTSIGVSSFSYCSNLQNVSIPNSVTSIEYGAFQNCTAMSSVSIPSSVTFVGADVFNGTYWYKNKSDGVIYLDNWLLGFKNINPTGKFTIAEGTKGIASRALHGSQFSSVTIPNSVKFIGSEAFLSSAYLTSVIIPNSVTSIEYRTFYNCGSLNSIFIPNSVKSIDEYAFYGCSRLGLVLSGIETPFAFGESAFGSIYSKCTLSVPSGTKDAYIAAGWTENVFKGGVIETTPNITFADANVKALCIANWDLDGDGELNETEASAVTDLGTVFKGNTTITTFDELQYFTRLSSMSNYTFSGCTNLTSVIIPNSVSSIGNGALQNCKSLSSVTIPDNVYNLGYYAFYGCTGLTSITLSNNIQTISMQTFQGCNNLSSITIPASVKNIGSQAFECSALTAVTVEGSTPATISSDNSFSNRTNATLYVPVGSKAAYQEANYWKEFKEIIEVDNRNDQTLELTSIPAMTYGDAAYTLPQNTAEGLALTWSVDNDAVASISGNALTIVGAGTATVTASQAGNDSYKPFEREFTLTVNKAALTITADDKTKLEGEENPELTVSYSGFKYNDNATALTTQPTVTTTATKDSPVGTYPITVSGAASNNYTFNYVSGTLTVTEKLINLNNQLYAEDKSVFRNSNAVLPIILKNEDDVRLFQFDLTLPAGVTVATDKNGELMAELTERADAKHSLSCILLDNGDYRFMVSQNSLALFTGNDGAVANITLAIAKDAIPGAYQVSMKNIELTLYKDGSNVAAEPADNNSTLTVKTKLAGDANGDNKVTVTDIAVTVDTILANSYDEGADADGNGKVTVTDIATIVDIILTTPASSRQLNNKLDPQ